MSGGIECCEVASRFRLPAGTLILQDKCLAYSGSFPYATEKVEVGARSMVCRSCVNCKEGLAAWGTSLGSGVAAIGESIEGICTINTVVKV